MQSSTVRTPPGRGITATCHQPLHSVVGAQQKMAGVDIFCGMVPQPPSAMWASIICLVQTCATTTSKLDKQQLQKQSLSVGRA